MPFGMELPKSPEQKSAGRVVLDTLKEMTVENYNKITDWFKGLFAGSKEKGLKESLMGPFVGFLNLISSVGKGDEKTPASETVSPVSAQLSQLAQTVGTAQNAPQTEKREVSDAGLSQRILTAIKQAIDNRMPGRHCWDWAEKVYRAAGLDYKKLRIVYDTSAKQERGRKKTREPAPPSSLDAIQPGDWIYIHNGNTSDAHGNHSGIFIEWANPERRIAKLASCHGANQPGDYRNYDLNKNPVVFISHTFKRP